jgi:hypothetical protein
MLAFKDLENHLTPEISTAEEMNPLSLKLVFPDLCFLELKLTK